MLVRICRDEQLISQMCAFAGLHDSRVSYWEPAKWVAKTRQATAGHPVILLLTQMEAGHAGVGGVFSQLREVALEHAFLLRATCVAAPTPTQVWNIVVRAAPPGIYPWSCTTCMRVRRRDI